MGVIALFDGTEVLVDDEDIPRLLLIARSWNAHRAGHDGSRKYAATTAEGKHVKMHRVIMGLAPGDGQIVDHINGDRFDNRKSNLRIVTHTENMWNVHQPTSNNKSGFRGVGFHKVSGRWRARISVNRKQHNLGLFDSAEEAYEAYELAKKELHRI